MARIARVLAPGLPHHVVQRGNRRQPVFFSDDDRITYMEILKEQAKRFGVSIWAYCLMDNHVHFIAVPEDQEGLSHTFGQTHRHYTRHINFREGWRGYLWQGRFSSYVLDEDYLYAAVRYVENNPVKAKIVENAEDYAWSSAKARVYGQKDDLVSNFFLTEEIKDWSIFLKSTYEEELSDAVFESHLNTGRPFGPSYFTQNVEALTGYMLTKLKPGPKPKKGN